MSKKGIIGVIIVVVLVIIAAVVYFALNNNSSDNLENQNQTINNNEKNNVTETNTNEATANTAEGENTETGNGGILVVYYSAQGHTEAVSQRIAENLGADTFAITPVDEYSEDDLDWTDDNSRVSREYQNESLRNTELTTTTVENWDSYDTVLIGYPIWWGIAAWPVDTFVKANDFDGKTVIPFCTSSSSGLGQSGDLLAEEANGEIG